MSRFWDNKFARVLRVILITLALVMSLSACGQSLDESSEGKSACDIQLEVTNDCWQSSLFTLIYDSAGVMAVNLYGKVSEGAFGFIMVMFALWFAVKTLKIFNKANAQSSGVFWGETLKQLFVCVVCGVIVSNVGNILWILNNTIMPIFIAFIDFGSEILGGSLSGSGENYGACFSNGGTEATTGGLPEGPKIAIECLICKIHSKLVMGKALGVRMLGMDLTITGILIGLTYIFVFLIIDLAFVFYLVDTTIRLGLIVAMLPLWVIAYAFKSTRGYTNKAFENTLNCGATLAFVCIIMTLIIGTIQTYVTNKYPELSGAGCGVVDTDLQAVQAHAKPGIAFLSSLFLCFFLVSSISFATKNANGMVGGVGDGTAQKIKALAQGVIKVAVAGVGALATKTALAKKYGKAKEKWNQSTMGKLFQDPNAGGDK